MIIKIGTPPFPAKIIDDGKFLAKIEHIWQSARRYAKANGYQYVSSYGVIGVAPT
jgi:hypothetical protein